MDVQQQAATIRAMVKTKRGIDTYKTYWKKYEVWHANRFGEAAPTCPYTGLLWVNIVQAVQFVGWMGATGTTSSQVVASL